jgi:xanthine/uracil/vitamin C permease (AzgA family)
VLYPLVKLAGGRVEEVRPGGWVLAALSAAYYTFGLPH